ncbi:diguanylate cyclase [Candidatus Xianfuyuplasma coldseepsis]|uniref:Diguanylate cyclase n=1 Tax=Candidatus Xianfuyuplasma coldseepsis TaxID=2782163 RepID=A0A7L7KQU3_9MOLU|nr:diguanylate cyclase [Xianfuyuplasma coldseepsis]QMS85093.1 diguanylate cyclase [Xianfuyuplasma coldseepsis]
MDIITFLSSNTNHIVRICDIENNSIYSNPSYSIAEIPYEEGVFPFHDWTITNTILTIDNVPYLFSSIQELQTTTYLATLMNTFRNLGIPIAIIHNKQVLFRNETLTALLKTPEEDLTTTPWQKLQQPYKSRIQRLLTKESYNSAEIYVDINPDETHWFIINKAVLKIEGETYIIFVFQLADVMKQRELAYNQQQAFLTNVFESIFEGILVIDIHNNITFINQEAIKLLGVTKQVVGTKVTDVLRIFGANGNPFNYLIIEELKSNEYELETLSGMNYYINLRIRDMVDKNNDKLGKIISFFEIGEEKKREKEILYLTYHDTMTGLHNRTFFEEQLRLFDTPRKLPLSIILGDVNGLKLTNDVFGHEAGDLLLKRIARIMKSTCRQEDVIARWGGDEFIILLPNTNETQVHIIMNRIIAEIERVYKDHEIQSILPSLSLGYGVKTTETEDVYHIINIAEQNMYKRKMLTNSSIYSSIITSMTQSLFERSSETEEHANRLRDYAHKIARKLQVTEADIQDLTLLAKLHDIGKIGIPDEILNKPTSLTNDEWTIMKKHPEIGYRIANSTSELKGVATYILSHHERYDGTGYPKGLQGENIPLLSRIISVVDAYDAMLYDRPYRAALPHHKVIEEIQNNAGTQFDPLIATTFLQIIREEQEKAPQ